MIQPTDFLTLADTLVQASTEAEWRTAVSRAYYAAFLTTRQLLSDIGFAVPRAASAHGYLWLRLSNCGDPVIESAGSDLNDLQSDRNFADYDTQHTLTQPAAYRQVQGAHRILAALVLAGAEPLRSQVRDAIRDYERDILKVVTYQGP